MGDLEKLVEKIKKESKEALKNIAKIGLDIEEKRNEIIKEAKEERKKENKKS